MAASVQPIIVNRHSNRRLYNTRTGKYVSRKSLEAMARNGEEFVVFDAATGDDITRSVLGQIIVAQETVQSEPLLPIDFLRGLMGFYGDMLRTVLGCYLEFSLLTLTNESMRKQMTHAGTSVLGLVDEQVQRNIKFFETILTNFAPNPKPDGTNRPRG
jgi:polyhydroxyalkanoate synthesis repressor PhaR